MLVAYGRNSQTLADSLKRLPEANTNQTASKGKDCTGLAIQITKLKYEIPK